MKAIAGISLNEMALPGWNRIESPDRVRKKRLTQNALRRVGRRVSEILRVLTPIERRSGEDRRARAGAVSEGNGEKTRAAEGGNERGTLIAGRWTDGDTMN